MDFSLYPFGVAGADHVIIHIKYPQFLYHCLPYYVMGCVRVVDSQGQIVYDKIIHRNVEEGGVCETPMCCTY